MKQRGLRPVLAGVFLIVFAASASAAAPEARGRIFFLMVWDGLRPDFVTQRDTPNLYAMMHDGVRLERHHAIFPTVTMVNAAGLATGADSGSSGIDGDTMYLAPLLHPPSAASEAGAPERPASPKLDSAMKRAVFLENSQLLAELNGADALNGRVLGLDTVAQQVRRVGGYVAILGKRGPTFLFEPDAASAPARSTQSAPSRAADNYLFVAEDLVQPPAIASEILGELAALPERQTPAERADALMTRLAIEKALPSARKAADDGKPALIVLWLRDPDQSQHRAGLGTMPALEALGNCDRNLALVRAAIAAQGLDDRTDLMAVSDHGFATIRIRVELAELLVRNGFKESADSTDVVVAPNGGSDLIYLSAQKFPDASSRRELLQKIVNFAAAQEWCGPIFSRESSLDPRKSYLGWIDGTFSAAAVGMFNSTRTPDLVISFREISDLDNSKLTGPANPAFVLGVNGQRSMQNSSAQLVHKVKGVVYADPGRTTGFTTGMGMHGAAGAYELRNFCAAIGPDFRMRISDRSPTGNADIAPTISEILGLPLNTGPRAWPTGRVISEALSGGPGVKATRISTMTSRLELQGMAVVTTLKLMRVGDHVYLDDADVKHIPLGHSP
jgi:arylsulfatase A-like enzyme